jgi:hypothetical protein
VDAAATPQMRLTPDPNGPRPILFLAIR